MLASTSGPFPSSTANVNHDATLQPVGAVMEDEATLLAEALRVSAQETALAEERRSREDDELMLRIMELSLLEK